MVLTFPVAYWQQINQSPIDPHAGSVAFFLKADESLLTTNTTTTANFTVPGVGSTVTVNVGSTSGLAAERAIRVGSGAGNYNIASVNSGTQLTIRNCGGSINATAGTTIFSGATVALSIIDYSPSPKTSSITAYDNIQLTSNGIYFDGSGDYLQIPNNVDFDLGSGDYTIEWISRLDGTNLFYPTFFSLRTANTTSGSRSNCSYGDGGQGKKLNYQFPNGESNFTSSFTQNTDNGLDLHFALSRSTVSGTTTGRAFRNGVLEYSIVGNNSVSGAYLTVGQNQNQFGNFLFKGLIKKFRITKGVGRYTANFNPAIDTYLN